MYQEPKTHANNIPFSPFQSLDLKQRVATICVPEKVNIFDSRFLKITQVERCNGSVF